MTSRLSIDDQSHQVTTASILAAIPLGILAMQFLHLDEQRLQLIQD
jgi:hypothetical protein